MKLCDKSIAALAEGKPAMLSFDDPILESDHSVTYRKYTYGTITPQGPMITPFTGKSMNELNGHKVPSWGLSSAGYDVRLQRDVKIFTNIFGTTIDPRDMSEENYLDVSSKEDENGLPYVILPPNSYLLGVTMETFNIPRNVIATCLGKSTYARAGCAVNVTPIEPGFIGSVVIEIANQTTSPMKIYTECGIAQFMFDVLDQPCDVSYGDRNGKYQNQSGIQPAIC